MCLMSFTICVGTICTVTICHSALHFPSCLNCIFMYLTTHSSFADEYLHFSAHNCCSCKSSNISAHIQSKSTSQNISISLLASCGFSSSLYMFISQLLHSYSLCTFHLFSVLLKMFCTEFLPTNCWFTTYST